MPTAQSRQKRKYFDKTEREDHVNISHRIYS